MFLNGIRSSKDQTKDNPQTNLIQDKRQEEGEEEGTGNYDQLDACSVWWR